MAAQASDFLMNKHFTLLQKTLRYHRKLYFTTENFTTWKVFFLQNLCQLKFLLPFENQQSFFFFTFLILIDVLQYE